MIMDGYVTSADGSSSKSMLIILTTSVIILSPWDEHFLNNHNFRFAELTAAIFVREGIKVYLPQKVCPTPFVSFGVKKYCTAAGVMVTASHNPKEDNGYKVYWSNGSQVTLVLLY